ncbi:MAG: glycosyltransferase, partial [Oricola sp.]|nr:glycosyltransferase [Oricola sp.]
MGKDNSKLNITLCARTFSVQGGAERFLFNLAKHLQKRDHVVKVITLRAMATDGVSLEVVRKPYCVSRVCRDWVYGSRLASALLRDDCDVSFGEQKTWHCNVIRPGGGVEDEYWKTHLKYDIPGLHLPQQFRKIYLKRRFDLAAEKRGYTSPHFRQ